MDHFQYRNASLFAEEVPVTDLANQFGTPLYVYSRATFERHWHAFDSAFGDTPHLVCYAVKANSNLGVLNFSISESKLSIIRPKLLIKKLSTWLTDNFVKFF